MTSTISLCRRVLRLSWQSDTVPADCKPVGHEFDALSRNQLFLFYCFVTLNTQYLMPQKWSGKWIIEYLNMVSSFTNIFHLINENFNFSRLVLFYQNVEIYKHNFNTINPKRKGIESTTITFTIHSTTRSSTAPHQPL